MISVSRRQHTVLSEESSLPLRCPLLFVSMLHSSVIFLTFTSLPSSSSLLVLSVSKYFLLSMLLSCLPLRNGTLDLSVCAMTRFRLSKGGNGDACPGLRLLEAQGSAQMGNCFYNSICVLVARMLPVMPCKVKWKFLNRRTARPHEYLDREIKMWSFLFFNLSP